MTVSRLVQLTALLSFTTGAVAADLPLYPTGPAEDAAFVRFVSGINDPLEVVAKKGQAPLRLTPNQSVSQFYPVNTRTAIQGAISSGSKQLLLKLKAQPGEFISVAVLPDGKNLKQVTVRDTPDDFNGLKASVAFFNLDSRCSSAVVRPAGRNADLFKGVAEGHMQRRSINPVKLSVQLFCSNTANGPVVDLGELKAGQRYSLLLLPSATGPRLLQVTDTLSN